MAQENTYYYNLHSNLRIDMETSLQDCYYYYYSHCTKGEFCPYRHCEAALGSETVCEEWQQGECQNLECPYRHMEIQKKRTNIACYWESRAGGCRKPHCVFSHTRPRDEKGTILSEEEKLAAITSPPPQMAMPMADGPPPHDPFYDSLPQDKICSIDSPTVERVVINPLEEETDEESVHGTPVKSEISQRVSQLKLPPKQLRKPISLTKQQDGKDDANEDDNELNFAVKSLDEIRMEKLERAKKLIEEADHLLSLEAPELRDKIHKVKEKLEAPAEEEEEDEPITQQKPRQPRESVTQKSTRIKTSKKVVKVSAKSAGNDLPEVKSYEEILREKALASMMAAKAKKLKAQEDEKRQEERADKRRQEEESSSASARRVVVRRRADSPHRVEDKTTRGNIRSRLGHNSSDRIKVRQGIKEKNDHQSDSESRSKTNTKVVRPNIKSRLGVKSQARIDKSKVDDSSDEETTERLENVRAATKPLSSKITIKSRLGNQVKEEPPKRSERLVSRLGNQVKEEPPKRSERLGITMSDFSSDGMSEESSDEEMEKADQEHSSDNYSNSGRDSQSEEETEVHKRKIPIKSLNEVRKEKIKLGQDDDTDLSEIKVKSFEEIMREKALKKTKEPQLTGIKRKIIINVNKEETEESSPPKVTKRTIQKPNKVKANVKLGRQVLLMTEDRDDDSDNSVSSASSTISSKSSHDSPPPKVVKKKLVQEVVMKPVVEEKKPTRKLRTKVSPVKRDRKAPVMLYRPPALKHRETVKPVEDAKPKSPVRRSATKENKDWGVKTFSEILHEKQHNRKKTVENKKDINRSVSPLDMIITSHTSREQKGTKRLFSPIKFDSSDGKPAFKKISISTDKRSDSPEVDLYDEPDNTASTSQLNKKIKRSTIWSSRRNNDDQRDLSMNTTGARKLGIHKRLGVKNSAVSSSNNRDEEDVHINQKSYPRVSVKVKSPLQSKITKPPLKVNVKDNGRAINSPKDIPPKLASPLGLTATSKRKNSITRESPRRPSIASSTKSDNKDADESLNLNDTDLLEAELLELLGGNEGIKKTESETITTDQFGEEDDLLLEELLS